MSLKKKEKYIPVQPLVGEGTDYNVYNATVKEKAAWFLIGMLVSGAVLYISMKIFLCRS